jgi:hypothetical protein
MPSNVIVAAILGPTVGIKPCLPIDKAPNGTEHQEHASGSEDHQVDQVLCSASH